MQWFSQSHYGISIYYLAMVLGVYSNNYKIKIIYFSKTYCIILYDTNRAEFPAVDPIRPISSLRWQWQMVQWVLGTRRTSLLIPGQLESCWPGFSLLVGKGISQPPVCKRFHPFGIWRTRKCQSSLLDGQSLANLKLASILPFTDIQNLDQK